MHNLHNVLNSVAADQLSLSYYKSFNLPITILRPFNTYGPRQSKEQLPRIIKMFIYKKIENLTLGNINPTRDFNYVSDI